jgi:DNA-binding MarR family transcriptional regulator
MLSRAEALDAPVRNLRALILAGENYRQATAQMSGLGVTESQALSYLAIHGERGQNDLGTDLGLSSGAATALVDRLERQGVAQRDAHPYDRRRVVVRLTDKGHALVARSHNWLAASFESIPPEDLQKVSTALRQIAQVLRAESERQLASDQQRSR